MLILCSNSPPPRNQDKEIPGLEPAPIISVTFYRPRKWVLKAQFLAKAKIYPWKDRLIPDWKFAFPAAGFKLMAELPFGGIPIDFPRAQQTRRKMPIMGCIWKILGLKTH